MTFAILIPVYDDWPSLATLIREVHAVMENHRWRYRIFVIDDASPTEFPEHFATQRRGDNCESIAIVRLQKNLGHQRSIAVGLVAVAAETAIELIVVMDGDGEDSPRDIPRLIEACMETGLQKVVFARRTRRVETLLFKFGYELYCLLHRIAVGRVPRVGNFSVLPRKVLPALLVDPNLWNHFAAAVFASRLPRVTLPTPRGQRFQGKSKLNFNSLVIHGLSALACYSDKIGVRVIMVTAILMTLTLVGVITVAAIRLFTPIAVPGWATAATGVLMILCLQLLTLAFAFCLNVLSRRQDVSFLPIRDAHIYIASRVDL